MATLEEIHQIYSTQVIAPRTGSHKNELNMERAALGSLQRSTRQSLYENAPFLQHSVLA